MEQNKLKQIKDIEEELGIDLITFLKAITQGIYLFRYKKLYLIGILEANVYFYNNKEKCFEEKIQDMNASWTNKYYLKDYGKTWALTKEELL